MCIEKRPVREQKVIYCKQNKNKYLNNIFLL